MSVVEIDKQEGYIVRTEDAVVNRTSITMADTVVSVAPTGFRKVTNIYIEPVSGKLVVIYEE